MFNNFYKIMMTSFSKNCNNFKNKIKTQIYFTV